MAEVNYTVASKEDKYTITNNENLPINYTLIKTDKCSGLETIIETLNISSGVSYTLPIKEDGYYIIKLASTEFANTFSTLYINYFVNMHASMIEDVFSVLCPCDCGCAACTDLGVDQYQALITTRNKIDIYQCMTSPQYDPVLKEVCKGAKCMLVPQIYCDIAQEGVTGENQYNEKLTMQLIALDYLAMYFWDLKNVIDPEQIAYINEKYKADEILCCISKLGIDINKIKQIVENMASGTITSGVYVSVGPTDVGFLNIDVDNREIDYPFTITDFTENVAAYPPPANDPNPTPSDNVFFAVRIDSLLAGTPLGMLKYNGTAVAVGDIIEFSNIANLTYTSPDIDPVDVDTFTYSISNVGAPTTFIS